MKRTLIQTTFNKWGHIYNTSSMLFSVHTTLLVIHIYERKRYMNNFEKHGCEWKTTVIVEHRDSITYFKSYVT